jgi:hypothetical protein
VSLQSSSSIKVSQVILVVWKNERTRDGKVRVLLMMMVVKLGRRSRDYDSWRTRGEVRERSIETTIGISIAASIVTLMIEIYAANTSIMRVFVTA